MVDHDRQPWVTILVNRGRPCLDGCMNKTERAKLEAAKEASALQLLFKAARLANEKAIGQVNEKAGAPVFRESLSRLLPHLTPEGVRVVDLARKLDVSKQAVSKLVAEFAEQGVLEYVAEPDDARVRRVRLTAKGYAGIHHGLGV